MKTFACLLLTAIVLLPADAFARHRMHVVIHKRPPHVATQPVAVPVAVIPVLGMFYDLARRTGCEGDVLGLGGPGFDRPVTPRDGNVMIPAQQRGGCPAPAPVYR